MGRQEFLALLSALAPSLSFQSFFFSFFFVPVFWGGGEGKWLQSIHTNVRLTGISPSFFISQSSICFYDI
jgi:hypothetical protein